MRDIYLINEVIDRYRWVYVIENDRDWGLQLARLRGQPVPADFGPVEVEWAPAMADRAICDFPNFRPNLLCISNRAAKVLSPLLHDFGQFIALSGLDYSAFYCLTTVDCVDEKLTDARLKEEGLFSYHKPDFAPTLKEECAAAGVFRTPESISKIFVPSEFKEAYAQNGLTGLEFTKVPLV